MPLERDVLTVIVYVSIFFICFTTSVAASSFILVTLHKITHS